MLQRYAILQQSVCHFNMDEQFAKLMANMVMRNNYANRNSSRNHK
jgi:hypothetical protein